jgi:hypothetical protein
LQARLVVGWPAAAEKTGANLAQRDHRNSDGFGDLQGIEYVVILGEGIGEAVRIQQ